MTDYVSTYRNHACISGLAYMELPEVLQRWVDGACLPGCDADVYLLPSPAVAEFRRTAAALGEEPKRG